ncbi:MAG: uridylate kinase [Planctomycetes bacterium]|nr:uridylate kinase [Planctomycetota bacterium]
MSRNFLRVAKVGGSLFDLADLPVKLRCWIDSQPGVNVLVAGGGRFGDSVRQADDTFALGDATAHRLALDAMCLSAELLAVLLPEMTLLHSLHEVGEKLSNGESVVFNPREAMESPSCQLPHSWDVTSDSIAAYIASELRAQELVLLKSTLLPVNTNRSQAAEAGLVDAHFPQAAPAAQSVRWVNLRSTPVTERPLRS